MGKLMGCLGLISFKGLLLVMIDCWRVSTTEGKMRTQSLQLKVAAALPLASVYCYYYYYFDYYYCYYCYYYY